MKKKNRGQVGEVAVKLGISKAYDRVDWRYLKGRMKSMGFCDKWISWVMMCVSTVNYMVSFNGSLVGPVKPRRGLRKLIKGIREDDVTQPMRRGQGGEDDIMRMMQA
ncbi:hypothetical protein AgCh_000412 [Apium graveolens]